MATFRIQKTENYVVLDKGFLNNAELSWQAKGLLAYMLALPNDWSFSIVDLTNRSKNGRDATKTIVNELCLAGYIRKKQGRNGAGKFGSTEFLVFETPNLPQTENQLSGIPHTENPSTESPFTGNPLTDNPSLLSNELLNNELLNNYYDDKEEKATPTKTAFAFYQENGFGVLSGYVSEKVGAWVDDIGDDLVIHAMKLAIENNAIKWSYVETILRGWSQKQIKTIEQAEAEKVRFAAEKSKRQTQPRRGNYSGGRKVEIVPEWFNKPEHPPQASVSPKEPIADIDVDAEYEKLMEQWRKMKGSQT